MFNYTILRSNDYRAVLVADKVEPLTYGDCVICGDSECLTLDQHIDANNGEILAATVGCGVCERLIIVVSTRMQKDLAHA